MVPLPRFDITALSYFVNSYQLMITICPACQALRISLGVWFNKMAIICILKASYLHRYFDQVKNIEKCLIKEIGILQPFIARKSVNYFHKRHLGVFGVFLRVQINHLKAIFVFQQVVKI